VIAIDTSSLVAYLSGSAGEDVTAVDLALSQNQACLPPVVLTELLSDPKLPNEVAAVLRQIPVLAISHGYWDRAGLLRSKIIARKRRARLADSLIAQTCLDHNLALITRDADFRAFARAAGLKLVTEVG
jgi:predicted nucleic acid-binding protein